MQRCATTAWLLAKIVIYAPCAKSSTALGSDAFQKLPRPCAARGPAAGYHGHCIPGRTRPLSWPVEKSANFEKGLCPKVGKAKAFSNFGRPCPMVAFHTLRLRSPGAVWQRVDVYPGKHQLATPQKHAFCVIVAPAHSAKGIAPAVAIPLETPPMT